MKVLITAPTVIRGEDVSAGDIRDVTNNDAYTLIECRKATRDPARIAAREAEITKAPEIETATAAPAAETAARNPVRRSKSGA